MLKSDKKEIYFGIERDKARYFHGRKEELNHFRNLLNESKIKGVGSSFLIQGAPGIGKTALIHECVGIAKKSKWNVVKINIETLSNPTDLFYRITKDSDPKTYIHAQKVDLALWKTELRTKTKEEINYVNEELIKSKPTLLVLDETQNLGIDGAFSNDKKGEIIAFLEKFHNLKTKKGFAFLFAGLSNTKDVLKEFGISRFNSKYSFNLQPLDKESERAIIRDWINEKVKGDEAIEGWIDKITPKTYQWAKHITSYCNAIHNQLQKVKKLSKETLQNVLDEGDYLKKDYYSQRCVGLLREDREILAKLVQTLPNVFTKTQVIDFLSKENSLLETQKFFDFLMVRGIFHLGIDGDFSISMPSFKTWLVEQYGGE